MNKQDRAHRNQRRLEQFGWINDAPLSKRKGFARRLNARQYRRFKYWGRVAAKELIKTLGW